MPKRTEIQGFTSYPCWITFRKKCFRTNGGCLHIHYFFFKSKKYTQVTVKNKIDAAKENQCTTRWLLNGFLSHEMFILAKKMVPRVLHLNSAFSTRPRVFHQTPRFPHPAFPTPRDPVPRTARPRPRVFHLAKMKAKYPPKSPKSSAAMSAVFTKITFPEIYTGSQSSR